MTVAIGGMRSVRWRALVWSTPGLALMALVITFLLTAGAIALAGADPLTAYAEFLIVPLTSRFSVLEVLVASTPILLTGAAVALAFRGGYWNIGAEGQLLVGAIMAAAVGQIAGLPQVVAVPLMILGGAIGGALWALGPALLRVRFGIDEVVTTLLLNPVALLLVNALLHGPWRDPVSGFPESPRIAEAAEFPQLLERSRLHLGFLVALMVVTMVGYIVGRTPAGLRLRAVGLSPHGARFAGIDVGRTLLLTALASGAIAGIAGVGEVAGIQFRLTSGLSPGYGYTGIVVATLGGLTMPGVTVAALLLGDLSVGASSAGRALGIPSQLGAVVQGTLLLVTIALLAIRRNRLVGSALTSEGAGVAADAVAADMAVPPLELDEMDAAPSAVAGDDPRPMTFFVDLLAATLRNATPLVYGGVGETFTERAGVLNLGIEGTMYAGAFTGFAVAYASGSLLLGLTAAIVVGLLAGGLMALLTVTLGANQHVSGIGLTIGLIGLSEFANRLIFGGTELVRIDPFPALEAPAALGPLAPVFSQYGLTWLAFLVVVPAAWWLLNRSSFGLDVRAVGENPEAADAAGIRVGLTRYLALMLGGALMAIGGAFITLALLGSFTLDIIAGRGWVAVALVIFGRWRIMRVVGGALLFAAVYSLQLRLRILPGFGEIPFELLLALPYLVVIAALAISGRNVAYPGAYLKPYRRS